MDQEVRGTDRRPVWLEPENGEAGEPEAGALAGPRGSWMSLQPGLPGAGSQQPRQPHHQPGANVYPTEFHKLSTPAEQSIHPRPAPSLGVLPGTEGESPGLPRTPPSAPNPT